MLNCFFWYAAIWIFILILYSFNITSFNQPLDKTLLIFILITTIISIIFGIIFRNKFKGDFSYGYKISNLKIKLIIIGFFINFAYSKSIPFLSIVFLKNRIYGEFEGIPLFFVFLVAYSEYSALKYFYSALCNKYNRKKNIRNYLLILLMFLLCYFRSMIVINVFMAMLLLMGYLKNKNTIKIKHLRYMLVGIIILCYFYGGIGNMRQGFTWNDNHYIQNLGLYTSYPKYLPKQFMWTYSYLTSPLANLNYNVINTTPNYNINSIISATLPSTISKRLFNVHNANILLIRDYFNANTGWCNIYAAGGINAMYFLYFYMVALTLISLKMFNYKKNKKNKVLFSAILCIVYIFMFFYNTLAYVGISLLFWISFFSLVPKLYVGNKKEIKYI